MKKRKITLLAAVLFLAIGFAAVSTTLIINGTIALVESDDFKVIFTSAKLDGRKRNDFIDETKKNINFDTKVLVSIDDETTLDYEVTNTSRNYDANVTITCLSEENDLLSVEYSPKNMIIEAGNTEQGSLTVKLIKVATKDMELNMTCSLVATPTERDALGEEYIVDKNLVMPVNPVKNEENHTYLEGAFWDYKENIEHVVFEDNTNNRSNAAYTFDISANQDKSVMSYLVQDSKDNTKYTLYIQSDDKVILNPKSEYFFTDFSILEDIEGLDRVDTSNVTSMKSFFYGCSKLKSLDVSNFDTQNVTNMQNMFCKCNSLTTLNLSNFDTSNVTTMRRIFRECSGLTTLDLSGFDTSNVTDMSEMFNGCESLTKLDVSKFDTSNVTRMDWMFADCHKITNIDLSNFATTNVTTMLSMFYGCNSLTTIDLSNFDTGNVTDMGWLFNECNNLTTVNLSSFNIANVNNMTFMFCECSSLTVLDLSVFHTSVVQDMRGMFYGCSSLTKVDLSNFDVSIDTSTWDMFSDSSKLTNIDLRSFSFDKITNATGMFNALPNNTKVIVKDAQNQNIVLNSLPKQDSYLTRPSSWTTANIIIAS